ncbi:MAG: hypothetical protein K6E56_03805 [Lachnospiraceae bacterium]|nr:hypothetical protein [Lachnospiraceae bacterium]
MSKKKKKYNNSGAGNINKSLSTPVAEVENTVVEEAEEEPVAEEIVAEEITEAQIEEAVKEEEVKEPAVEAASEEAEPVKEAVTEEKSTEPVKEAVSEEKPAEPAKKSVYAERVKSVLEELDAEEDTDDGFEVTETAVIAEEAENLKKERIKKRESERGNVFSFASGLSDKNKKLCVLGLYAVLALLAIIIGIFASKMPVVAVCVIVIFQVAFVILLDENPIWLHLIVFALDVIAGLFTHHALFMLFAALVYIGGVVVLEILQRISYKNKGKKRVEQA